MKEIKFKDTVLYSWCLLSKWGFNDGDLFDEYDLNHNFLCAVVKRKLIPKLEQKVEIISMETIHNPIRAKTVDGVDVTKFWYDDTNSIGLSPKEVIVTAKELEEIYKSGRIIWKEMDL